MPGSIGCVARRRREGCCALRSAYACQQERSRFTSGSVCRRHVQAASSARPARATQYLRRGWPEDAARLGAHPCSRLSNPSFVKSSSWRPYAPAGRTRRCCSHHPDNYKTSRLTTLLIAVPARLCPHRSLSTALASTLTAQAAFGFKRTRAPRARPPAKAIRWPKLPTAPPRSFFRRSPYCVLTQPGLEDVAADPFHSRALSLHD
jgi:hypothetical protein